MARPPKDRDIKDDELPTKVAAAVTEEHKQAAALQGAIQQDIHRAALINQGIGKRRALNAMSKFITAVDLIELAETKASKEYKGFVCPLADGTTLTIGTWEEFCVHVVGRSVDTVDNALGNMAFFGQELYDAMQAVGLGPSKMRSLRQLPEEQQAQLETLKTLDDKDEMVELVDALLDKQRQKVAERDAHIEEQEKTISAKDAVAAVNRVTIDDLQTQLQRVAQLPPDEIDKELREEAGQRAWSVESELRGNLREALVALSAHAEANGIDIEQCLAGHLNQIEQSLADLRAELGIFITLDVVPAWSSTPGDSPDGDDTAVFEPTDGGAE